MSTGMHGRIAHTIAPSLLPLGVAAMAFLWGCSATNPSPGNSQTAFDTPAKAVEAVAAFAGSGDEARSEELFGEGSVEVIRSGDDVADRQAALEIKRLIEEKVEFEDPDAKTRIALLGNEAWPFPIPLVKTRGGWRFDLAAGREELENRRVGRNELSALATLHAVVDAQREYAARRYGGRAAYAQRAISSKGEKDGLYWPTPPGAPTSPLGPLVAEATTEGYSAGGDGPRPYHGYLFRMLTAQGPTAPGGAASYLDSNGAMTKGFAMVAWPARYGNSGVMTFLVDRHGIVFQKDLGERTAEVAMQMAAFDPDETWMPTGD